MSLQRTFSSYPSQLQILPPSSASSKFFSKILSTRIQITLNYVTWPESINVTSWRLLPSVLLDSNSYLRLPRLRKSPIWSATTRHCSRQHDNTAASLNQSLSVVQTHTVTWSLLTLSRDLCSTANRIEMSFSHQTIVILQWFVCLPCVKQAANTLYVLCLCFIWFLTQPTYVCLPWLSFQSLSPNLSC